MHQANVDRDPVCMRNDERFLSILTIGDSWFWCSFPGGVLLNYHGHLVAPRDHVILAYGTCNAVLVDVLTALLDRLCGRYQGKVFLVDSRNTMQGPDWASELHPTPAGFGKTGTRWLRVLREQGLAP